MELSQENFILLIVSGSAVMLLVAVSFIWLAKRNFSMQMKHQKEMFRMLLEAQEKERHRITQDLHDGIGPDVSSIKLIASSIKASDKEESHLIESLTRQVDHTIVSIRNIIRNLRPHEFSKMGLQVALTNLCRSIEDNHHLKIELVLEGMKERLPDLVEVNVYRIVQELLNNSLKHAEAKKISLNLIMDTVMLKIDYADDGKGYIPEKITPGMGLGNIKARVDLFRGKMLTGSEPGKGTWYKISFRRMDLKI
jgi:two-component system NarL family sensor kinase